MFTTWYTACININIHIIHNFVNSFYNIVVSNHFNIYSILTTLFSYYFIVYFQTVNGLDIPQKLTQIRISKLKWYVQTPVVIKRKVKQFQWLFTFSIVIIGILIINLTVINVTAPVHLIFLLFQNPIFGQFYLWRW